MMNVSHSLHQNIPLIEKLKGIPEIFGIRLAETPRYRVLHKRGPMEIRSYEPMVLASVQLPTDSQGDRRLAFLTLADYIFGRNEGRHVLPMSVPILLEPVADHFSLSFILPSHLDAQTAPKPFNPEVEILSRPPTSEAVFTYYGSQDSTTLELRSLELSRWLHANPDIQINSHPFYAVYDGPATIPFLKKNEVHVAIRQLC